MDCRPDRRAMLSSVTLAGVCAVIGGAAAGSRPARAEVAAERGLTPDAALALLKEGNRAFLDDAPQPPPHARERRLAIAREQHPFVVLVGCSDSRVPPEILFRRGLGDLFIIRVAGNTVDRVALGSIEYAVEELGAPLVVVLGHERCGAVHAAVEVVERDRALPGAIGEMVEPILPAVLRARSAGGDLLDAAVRENVRRVAARLRDEGPILAEKVRTGALRIVGARYDLDDGMVDFFDEG